MELELKTKMATDGYAVCFCGKPAFFLNEIGTVQAKHGSLFDVCGDEWCEEKAFELASDNYKNYKRNAA